MTIFKTFDIDYNKVTIDDLIIYKPDYVSAKVWLDFWDFSKEANIGNSIDSIRENAEQKGYDMGLEASEDEHEKEISNLFKRFEKSVEIAYKDIEVEAYKANIDNEAFLDKIENILYEAVPQE